MLEYVFSANFRLSIFKKLIKTVTDSKRFHLFHIPFFDIN